jgi:ADP-heptose:LPS heptosyltransferase
MKNVRSKDFNSNGATLENSGASIRPCPPKVKEQKSDTVVYGVFKGMGDLLSAAPVIISELNCGIRVILVVFAAVKKLIDLLDFGDNQHNLTVTIFPAKGSFKHLFAFISETSKLAPDFIWISPHSPAAARSWKVPIFFWLMKTCFWRRAKLAGAESERFSRLFDIRVAVDRRLPLAARESTAYAMARWEEERKPLQLKFKDSIHRHRHLASEFDILIHPGANADNRKWPAAYFIELINTLPNTYRIGVVGLPNDVEAIRLILPQGRHLQYIAGSLEQAIISIAKTRVLLSMDSGTTFFATILGVYTVALFGPVDPVSVLPVGGTVLPIYERNWPCQPCGNSRCSQSSNFCLTSLEPKRVAAELLRRLEAESNARPGRGEPR